jgi:hypothetical protein
MTPTDPLAVAARVATALDELGLSYSIGGSLASSFSGEPRSTLDIDIVVAFEASDAVPIATALESEFYVDAESLARAARNRSSANIVHSISSIKVDLFVAGGTELDAELLGRRVMMPPTDDRSKPLWFHSAEDILLQKLRWYRRGGEMSDRQWRDVVGLVRVQGARLDRVYLTSGAARLGVVDLLEKALAS